MHPVVDLSTDLAGLRLPNPLMTASGCAAAGRELHQFFDLAELGAVVTKSVMREVRSGRPTPRMVETPSGMLNSIGLQGPGIDAFLEHDLPWLRSVGARAIVSIAGEDVGEFRELAQRLGAEPGLGAVEVNISCPNVANRGLVFACEPTSSAAVISAVRDVLPQRIPVLAKLSPDVTDIVQIAAACVASGADALTMVNTLLGLAIDLDRLRPRLAGLTGGLSGPAIRPVAVRCIWQVHAAMRAGVLPQVPIVGVGGVRSGRDALELVLAGASAIQVGTAIFNDPCAPIRVRDELARELAQRGIARFADAVTSGRRACAQVGKGDAHQWERGCDGGGEVVTGNAFGARLRSAMQERGPLCVGIDPHPALLAAWGLSDDERGLERFAQTCVEALAGDVAVLKPQSAFFERHGARGIAVLERVLAGTRAAGALALLDVKRGDIGSTMAAYAQAYLDPTSPLAADAVTLSPFLGYESLRPALDAADEHGAGVFVLALTSNPDGAQVQHARSGTRSVAQSVIEGVRADNADAPDLGRAGLVIGATVGAAIHELGLDLLAARAPILAPGIGAQGGRPADLVRVFGDALPNVLPSSSRDVLAAGPSVSGLREAAQRIRDDVLAAVSAASGTGESALPGRRGSR